MCCIVSLIIFSGTENCLIYHTSILNTKYEFKADYVLGFLKIHKIDGYLSRTYMLA